MAIPAQSYFNALRDYLNTQQYEVKEVEDSSYEKTY